MRSIRQFLLLALTTVLTGMFALAFSWGFIESRHEIDEVFDARLAQYARLLASSFSHSHQLIGAEQPLVIPTLDELRLARHIEPVPESEEMQLDGHKYESNISFQLWRGADELIARSSTAPQQPLAPFELGYHDMWREGVQWRVFVLKDRSGLWIMSGESLAIRGELVNEIAAVNIPPALVGAALTLFLLWCVLKRGLQPLQLVARAIRERSVDDLRPVVASNVPLEITPLVDNLNQLLVRLDEALQRERRFSADAAHELKTPLAGLKLNLENLQLQHADINLQPLCKAVDKLIHIVQQMLTLARLEPYLGLEQSAPVALLTLCREALAGLAPLAMVAGIELALEHEPPDGRFEPWVVGDATLLDVMLRNLIENSLRHTPAHGSITVWVGQVEGEAVLRICDSGPGIPAAERARVLERFYRVGGDGASGAKNALQLKGAGLGLSIVREVLRLHGGRLQFDDRAGGGLQVTVSLPLKSMH